MKLRIATGAIVLALSSQQMFRLRTTTSSYAIQSSDQGYDPAVLLNTICPAAQDHNITKLMSKETIRKVMESWHQDACVNPNVTASEKAVRLDRRQMDEGIKKTCQLEFLGRRLLQEATRNSEMLLTVQVGGMDGKEADPMYGMFVTENSEYNRMFNGKLTHWLPVVVEPVPYNHQNLQQTYQEIDKNKHLPCRHLVNAAISYDNYTIQHQQARECTFCHFDMDSTNPTCVGHASWMKQHLGTLNCTHSRKFFQKNFDTCIAQTPLPCGTIGSVLSSTMQNTASSDNTLLLDHIGLLQLDIEGYEALLLPGLLRQELRSQRDSLPLVIHFEHKVMKEQKTLNEVVTLLEEELGYKLYDQGEDYLALLV